MYDDFDIPSFEPLVPASSPLSDWSRVPPRTRRPVVLPPLFGQKKKPAKRHEMRYYQMVTRGLV